MRGYRKVVMFLIFVIVAIGSSFILSDTKYAVFLDKTSWVIIGFFAGNAISHIGNGKKIEYPEIN